jgi:hypothetical protein
MALPYKKLTEEQDQMRNVLDKGEYPFRVLSIAQKPTKKGDNQMLEVELMVMDMEGREVKVRDWIILTMEEMSWKFRHFAATCGLLDRYDADLIEARDFLDKHGVVKLSIAEYEQEGEKRKVNRVADYVKPGMAKPVPQKNDNSFLDDDVPNFT